jgi:hypothetical protein
MAERLPPRLLQAYAACRDKALRAAANVARGVHATGATAAQQPSPGEVRALKRREAEALLAWARRHDRLVDGMEFERKWIEQGHIGGQENDVFLEAQRVWKRNNLSFHLSYADFFDRLALHRLLFPGAPLRFEGFIAEAASLWPVMSQPVVRAGRGAVRAEVEKLMHRLDFVRVRNDDYRHAEGIIVEDLHDENVFLDLEGNVVVIDPVIYLRGQRPTGKISSSPSRHPSRRSLVS